MRYKVQQFCEWKTVGSVFGAILQFLPSPVFPSSTPPKPFWREAASSFSFRKLEAVRKSSGSIRESLLACGHASLSACRSNCRGTNSRAFPPCDGACWTDGDSWGNAGANLWHVIYYQGQTENFHNFIFKPNLGKFPKEWLKANS